MFQRHNLSRRRWSCRTFHPRYLHTLSDLLSTETVRHQPSVRFLRPARRWGWWYLQAWLFVVLRDTAFVVERQREVVAGAQRETVRAALRYRRRMPAHPWRSAASVCACVLPRTVVKGIR